jgi:hypothetical protein
VFHRPTLQILSEKAIDLSAAINRTRSVQRSFRLGFAMRKLLTQLAQLGGGFANFAGNAPSQLNGLAAISGRFARVVATKAIPFCSWI